MNGIRRAVLRKFRLTRSGESAAARPHEAGDDARAIDWIVTARLGRLMTRARNLDAQISWVAIVDRSPAMFAGGLPQLQSGAECAVQYWLSRAGPSDRCFIAEHRMARSALEYVLSKISGPAAVIVVSDFGVFAEIQKLTRILGRRAHCAGLLLCDPWHAAFPFRGSFYARDSLSKLQRRVFIDPQGAARIRSAAAAREETILTALRKAGWLATPLRDGNGVAAIDALYGLP